MAHTVILPPELKLPPWILLDLIGKIIGKVCKRLNLQMDVAALGKDSFVIYDPTGEIQKWEPYIRTELLLGGYDGALVRIILDMWYPQYTSGGADV